MRKYMNAVIVTKVAEWCANIDGFIRPMAIIHLALGFILSTLSVILGLTDMMTISFLFYALPAFTAVVAGLGAGFYRTRTIGDEALGAYLYAMIADELRSRGIKNAKRYLLEHPAHVAACSKLGDSMRTVFSSENLRAIQSFIFMKDEDPERTLIAILAIISERKVYEPAAIKSILTQFEEASTPLMSGAL